MKRANIIFGLLAILAVPSLTAQINSPSVISVPSTPSTCSTLPLKVVRNSANLYGSNGSGGCTAIGGGGTTVTVASGALALATSAISSGACQTVTQGSVNSATATGVLTTDAITFTPNGSIKAVTGYTPATTGGLTITAYPTAGFVNFDVCNWSGSPITPGAVTLNWRVVR